MMDTDMMEEETATPPTPTPEMTLNSDQGDGVGAVRDLLALARQLIDQGKPSQALQLVLIHFPYEIGCFSISILFFFFFEKINSRRFYVEEFYASFTCCQRQFRFRQFTFC